MSGLGTYRPGGSALHRLPPGAKLLGLVGVGVGLAFARVWWQAVLAAVVLAGLYLLARLGPAAALAQLRPLAWIGAAVAGFHLVVNGWRPAVQVVAALAALVLAAGLVTATTSTAALLETLVRTLRPLRRLGVDPERVGLLLALSVRSVAVVAELARDVRDAQRARGRAASPRSFAVPLLVRALRHAQRTGEALAARGVDD